MGNIALTTVLFDYPDYYEPTFYQKGLNDFNKEDIHIVRYSNLINTESYYDKLYYYKVVKFFEYVRDNLLVNMNIFYSWMQLTRHLLNHLMGCWKNFKI